MSRFNIVRTSGVTPFPLYDQLAQRVQAAKHGNQGPSTDDWLSWSALIAELPDQHLRFLFALIIHYHETECQLRNRGDQSVLVPYGGKTFDVGKGVLYQGNNLPIPLQWIIGEYLREIA